MQAVERYLHAVKFWLPADKRQDIVDELSEGITNELDGKEAELGRPLEKAEVEAVLKRWGSPVTVAQRYLPQEYLVGPVLFPIYRLVLEKIALFYLMPWLIVWATLRVLGVAGPGEQPWPSLGALLSSAVYLWAFVTGLFVLVDRTQRTGKVLDALGGVTPLAPPADPFKIPRATSIGELTGSLLFLAWIVGLLHFPLIFGPAARDQELTFVPEAVWSTLYWPMTALWLWAAVLAGINLVRPYWTPVRAAARLLSDVATALVAAWLLQAPRWLVVAGPMTSEGSGGLTFIVNWGVHALLLGMLVITAFTAFGRGRLVARLLAARGVVRASV